MEIVEQERFETEREKKMIANLSKIMNKQSVERTALEKKLLNQRQEKLRQREVETQQ